MKVFNPRKKALQLLLLLLTPVLNGHADTLSATSSGGYLPDFNYQLTDVGSVERATRIFDTLDRRMKGKSICANRAHIWAYEMYRDFRVNSGKVFIHFTAKGRADENTAWAYHVAPYVNINGEDYVMDAGGFRGIRGPTPLSTWTLKFGKSRQCVVLDPANNPAHLALEDNNAMGLANDPWMNAPKRISRYPVPENSTCYIRKVPMYYWMPFNVYGVDLYHSGNSDFSHFHRNGFRDGDLMGACKNAVKGGFIFRKKFCRAVLGF